MAFTALGKNKVLNDIQGALQVAAYNGDPESGGTELSGASTAEGASYARLTIAFNSASSGNRTLTTPLSMIIPNSATPAFLGVLAGGVLIEKSATGVGAYGATGGTLDINDYDLTAS